MPGLHKDRWMCVSRDTRTRGAEEEGGDEGASTGDVRGRSVCSGEGGGR